MKKVLAILLALAMILAVTACGKAKASTFITMSDEKTFNAEAKNADPDSAGIADFLLEKETVFTVTADIQSGSINLDVKGVDAKESLINWDFAETGITEYLIEPGQYIVTATVTEKETTGTLSITLEEYEEAVIPAYEYQGEVPYMKAVCDHMVSLGQTNYDKTDVSIPTVRVVAAEEKENGDVDVYGDFWIDNYDVVNDTLVTMSGGSYPGVMHVKKDGETYTVSEFEVVADGSDYTESAKKIFGKHYDDAMKTISDDEGRKEVRKAEIEAYVKASGLKVTQFKDYGWDPVVLDLK